MIKRYSVTIVSLFIMNFIARYLWLKIHFRTLSRGLAISVERVCVFTMQKNMAGLISALQKCQARYHLNWNGYVMVHNHGILT